jgi:bacillithiol system protein YtxJ
MGLFIEIKSEDELEDAFRAEKAVIFKHSTICVISARAYKEVERYAQKNPGVPVYLLDVSEQRVLSMRSAEHFGVQHESPQVTIINNYRPVWNGSHSDVTTETIEQKINHELS